MVQNTITSVRISGQRILVAPDYTLNVELGKQVSDLKYVFSLPSVPPQLRRVFVSVEIPFRVLDDFFLRHDQELAFGSAVSLQLRLQLLLLLFHLTQFPGINPKDLYRLVPIQPRVIQTDVYPGLRSLVQCANSVSGKEEDARVVLENAKKHRHERIPFELSQFTAGKEDVCLVEKENTVPQVC